MNPYRVIKQRMSPDLYRSYDARVVGVFMGWLNGHFLLSETSDSGFSVDYLVSEWNKSHPHNPTMTLRRMQDILRVAMEAGMMQECETPSLCGVYYQKAQAK